MNKQQNSLKKLEKARKLLQNGRLQDAKSTLESICKHPGSATQAWMMLSSVYGQLGFMDRVVSACDQVIARTPNAAIAHAHKGNALMALNRPDDAIPCYQKALTLAPGNALILNNYGQALYLNGRKDESIPLFQQAIEQQTGYTAAHQNLANALSDTFNYAKAIPHYLEALRLAPDTPGIHFKLAFAYQETAQLEDAEAFFRQALQSPPDREAAYRGLAVVLRYQGKLGEALSVYEAASKEFQNNKFFLAGIADVLERSREPDKALAAIRQLGEQGEPLNAQAVDVLTRICPNFDCCEEAIEQGKQLLDDNATSISDRITVHHALGKLLDKLDRFDDAFRHFEQGNNLADYSYDAAGHKRAMDDLLHTFRKEHTDSLPRASIRSERPLFIVGMPRSGTTLTEQIISSHPQVFGAGELDLIGWTVSNLRHQSTSTGDYPACLENFEPGDMNRLAEKYLEHLNELSADALRVTDKMPHNYMHLGLIQLLFPSAKVIHCIRNPVDTCLSIYFQIFNRAHSYSTKLEHLANYYLQYLRLMAHWRSALSIPMLEIKYEDLVANQEAVSRQLIDFCDLDWSDDCLSFHQSKRNISTASYNQANKPIYNKSVERWRNYQKHVSPLLPLLDAR